MGVEGAFVWDQRHGILEFPARAENAPFDIFRLISICWVWVEVNRLKVAIEDSQRDMMRPRIVLVAQVEQFARRCWQTYAANREAAALYADVEAPPWWDYGPTDVTRACPSTTRTPRKRSRTTSRS
jgi:hypothetical protein